MNIKDAGTEYSRSELKEDQLQNDPVLLFNEWFQQAIDNNISEVNAMTIATATPSGKPSARIVLLKEVDEKGFVFYTNYFVLQ